MCVCIYIYIFIRWVQMHTEVYIKHQIISCLTLFSSFMKFEKTYNNSPFCPRMYCEVIFVS